MYKPTKEDKLIIISLILILCFVIIVLTFETIDKFNNISKIDSGEIINNTLDSIYKELKNMPKNNTSSNIRTYLSKIFEFMNEKDYENLYLHLTDDFKNSHFPTLESFELYMEKYLNNEKYSPSFSKYESFKDKTYIVSVSFLPYKTDDSDILTNVTSAKSDMFTIYPESEEDYKFSFLGYIGSCKPNTSKTTKSVSITLEKVDLYYSKTIYTLDIKNNTNSDIFINDEKIYCFTGARPVYYPTPVLITANSNTKINFTIYTGLSIRAALPSSILFSEIIADNKVYRLSIPIEYPISIKSI